jgi:dual specificity phosphatase 12
MARVCDFIDQVRRPEQALPEQPATGTVLLHCDKGVSRSGTILIAYLMRKQGKTRDAVLADVREKWRRIKPSANFMDQLDVWEKVGYKIWEDEKGEVPKEEYKAYKARRAAALKAKGLTGNEPMRPLTLG